MREGKGKRDQGHNLRELHFYYNMLVNFREITGRLYAGVKEAKEKLRRSLLFYVSRGEISTRVGKEGWLIFEKPVSNSIICQGGIQKKLQIFWLFKPKKGHSKANHHPKEIVIININVN
ncbi:MAG TPA: hypothetical protein VIK89_09715 [Cytophagaceae bacterium]